MMLLRTRSHSVSFPARGKQRGVGLIEVMVAVLILAIGMLGIAALQTITLKNAGSSSTRTQAMVHVYGMGDTLRANKTRIAAFNTAGFSCSSGIDPDAKDPNADLNSWLQRLASEVAPSACGSVNCPAGNTCTVRVRWDDSRGTGGDAQTPTVISSTIRL